MAFSATVQGIGSLAGTVEGQTAFLASMAAMGPKGDKGDTGATGATGATGPQGPQGNTGAAATVNAGTTTTGAAGSSASVVNVGTTSAAIFDFTIPRGDKGEQGIQGNTGPKGDTGDSGVAYATAPLAYDAPTKTVSIDLSAYATQTFVTSQGYITSSALSPYLLISTAASTYQTISGMSSYAAKASSNTFTANQIIEVTDNTNAALRVTQLGTGEAFRVEDSTNPDSTPFVVTADGRVGIGTTSVGTNALIVASTAGNAAFNSTISVGGIATFNAGISALNAAFSTTTSSVPLVSFTQSGTREIATFTNTATATSPAVTITNLGTGNSFVVNDQASDPSPFVIDASGNVGVKTASPSTDLEVTGNIKSTTHDITSAPAAGDSSTKVPTTAWVQAEVPAASTSAAGKVQLATNAEVIARTNSTKSVTPAGVDSVSWLNSYDVTDATVGTLSTQVTTHTLLQAPPHRSLNNGGSTAAGSSLFWATAYVRRDGGVDGTINFSLPMALMFVASRSANPSTGVVFRAFVGKVQAGMGPGDLTVKGFGVKVDGSGVLQIMAHDGTNFTTTNTSFTPGTVGYACKVVSDGAGNISCYVNDSLVGTNTGGPVGTGSGYGYNIGCELQQVSSVTTTCRQFVGTFRYSQGYIR